MTMFELILSITLLITYPILACWSFRTLYKEYKLECEKDEDK